jgi:hypothetical protein
MSMVLVQYSIFDCSAVIVHDVVPKYLAFPLKQGLDIFSERCKLSSVSLSTES